MSAVALPSSTPVLPHGVALVLGGGGDVRSELVDRDRNDLSKRVAEPRANVGAFAIMKSMCLATLLLLT